MDLGQAQRLAQLEAQFDEFRSFEQLNNAAVDAKWREILVAQKTADQQGSVERVCATYTKQLDRCDAVIHRLLQWITEGEAQYQFALRAHKRNLEIVSTLANKRLDNQFERFAQNLQSLKDEYNRNRTLALAEYNRHMSEVRDVTNAIEHEYVNKKSQLDDRYRTEKENLQMKSQEAISAMRTHLTEESHRIIEAQKTEHDSFKSKSEGKFQQYHQMHEATKKRLREMKRNEEQILRLAAEISHWRRKIRNNERESQESNDRLRSEKENLSLHFRELKGTMAQFRSIESQKLAEISIAYDEALNVINDKLRLAEKILRYAEMTRKLETEREQLVPFPKSLTETDAEIVRQLQQFKLQFRGDPKYVAESDLFDKFYRRFNKTLLEKMTLQRERGVLKVQNMHLKSMMRKYLGGMGVSSKVISKPNTLFIVNQTTNALVRRWEPRLIPKTDAHLVVAANMLQGY
jgi:myosin heavy subunit